MALGRMWARRTLWLGLRIRVSVNTTNLKPSLFLHETEKPMHSELQVEASIGRFAGDT